MSFQRAWDDTCPRVWDRWEADGTTWLIQDLLPEDEDEALDILFKDFCPEETLFSLNKLIDDPESVRGMTQVWRLCFKQHLTLACYAESGGKRKLVALNVCILKEKDHEPQFEKMSTPCFLGFCVPCRIYRQTTPQSSVAESTAQLERLLHRMILGESLQNIYRTVKYMETQVDRLETMGLDKILAGVGLVVRKEHRGAKLGGKIIAAREPLCHFISVKGTATLFSGEASQKLAARCGFTTIQEVTVKELSEAGLGYPKDNNTLMKVMAKWYD
ncbi:uncharacterized protein ACR2FA_009544 [Aphomia sociella]